MRPTLTEAERAAVRSDVEAGASGGPFRGFQGRLRTRQGICLVLLALLDEVDALGGALALEKGATEQLSATVRELDAQVACLREASHAEQNLDAESRRGRRGGSS
jgi:hypothetical protein